MSLESEGWLWPAATLLGILLLLNTGLWIPSTSAWMLLAALAASLALHAILVAPRLAWSRLAPIIAGITLTVILTYVWLRVFGSPHLWLLQGDGNDTLYFFGGARWAAEHSLYTAQRVVEDSWGLGNCRQGAIIVGTGCPVYRNGVYTLMSILPSLQAEASANEVRSGISLIALCLFCGAFPYVSTVGNVRFGRWPVPSVLVAAAISIMVAISTGMVGAMANGNIGSMAGGAVIAMLVLWGMTDCSIPPFKALLLGGGAAVAGHLYGEAAIYACCVVAISISFDAYRARQPTWIIKGGLLAIVSFVAGLNVVTVELYKSIQEISGIVVASQWRAWYLLNEPVVWLAAPFTGIQMDGAKLVTMTDLFLGYCLACMTLAMGMRRRWLVMTTGLLILTSALFVYVCLKQYQYGEHKILQLVGPFWVAYLCALAYARWCGSANGAKGKLMAIGSLLLLSALSLNFLMAAKSALNIRVPQRSLSLEFAHPLRRVQAGDEVVIDQSAVANTDRFIKQDYATMLVHARGGRVLLSHRVDDTIPPHTQFPRTDTFKNAVTPDWLVRIAARGQVSILNDELTAADGASSEYDLVDLRSGGIPVVLAGDGWYQCEASHCWTKGGYSLEAYLPAICENGGILRIAQSVYSPPPGAAVTVSTDGRSYFRHSNDLEMIEVELQRGWSTVSVVPNWEIRSPAAVEGSGDARPLFAALLHVNVHCKS
jgi:hypothetical protein